MSSSNKKERLEILRRVSAARKKNTNSVSRKASVDGDIELNETVNPLNAVNMVQKKPIKRRDSIATRKSQSFIDVKGLRAALLQKQKEGRATEKEIENLKKLESFTTSDTMSLEQFLDLTTKTSIKTEDARNNIFKKYPKGTPRDKVSKEDQLKLDRIDHLDEDGDGEIELSELINLEQHLEDSEKERKRLQLLIAAAVCGLIVFMLVTMLSTYFANELSKESRVNNQGKLMSKDGKTMVSTENPRTYTTLLDLPKLPAKALNTLKQVSFTTKDGEVYSTSVFATRQNPLNPNELHLELSNGKELFINENMVELRMTSFNGKVTIIPVVTTPNANARRRALIERHLESDVDHEIKRRCNTKKKFCYHTFDEIVAINKPITVLNKRYVYILFMASSHIYIYIYIYTYGLFYYYIYVHY